MHARERGDDARLRALSGTASASCDRGAKRQCRVYDFRSPYSCATCSAAYRGGPVAAAIAANHFRSVARAEGQTQAAAESAVDEQAESTNRSGDCGNRGTEPKHGRLSGRGDATGQAQIVVLRAADSSLMRPERLCEEPDVRWFCADRWPQTSCGRPGEGVRPDGNDGEAEESLNPLQEVIVEAVGVAQLLPIDGDHLARPGSDIAVRRVKR